LSVIDAVGGTIGSDFEANFAALDSYAVGDVTAFTGFVFALVQYLLAGRT